MNEEETTTETTETTSKWSLNGRLKSKALWVAVVGLIMAIFSAFGLWSKIGIDSDTFSAVMTSIGSVLTAFGILNNPTDQEAF